MDLFGDLQTLTNVELIKRPPRIRPRSIPPIVDGGLFPLTTYISPERFSAVYHSGATAYYDCLGLTRSGKDIGTVAGLMGARVISLVRKYISSSGKLFIDTGAFTRFQEWLQGSAASPVVDFGKVFTVYDKVISDLPTDMRFNVALVMPDIVGNPSGTLELLTQHRDRILGYIGFGANVVVPLQKSSTPAGQTAEMIFDLLGTRDITLGIPSQAAAMALSDAATIRHNRFHILGRGTMNMALYSRAYSFLEFNPNAYVTCDANQLRSHTANISHEQKGMIEENAGGIWEGLYDSTELLSEIINQPGWMNKTQVTALAKFYGVTERKIVKQWIRTHAEDENGLRDLIDPLDPDGMLLWSMGIPTVFHTNASKHLSARMRAHAVERVFMD